MNVKLFMWVLVALVLFAPYDARRKNRANRSKCYGQYKCQKPTVSTYGRKYIDKCIDKENICNGKPNCPNKDDEINCPCPKLTNPTNGYVDTKDGFGINKVATYVCISGYFLSDLSTRTCMSNSQWSGTTPTCNIKDCGKLANIPNGSIQQPSTTFQAITTYSCDQGYTLKGNKQRTCQQRGEWFGITPKCENLNECTAGLATCGPNADCIDTLGSFDCVCKTGYFYKGVLCEDVNECKTGLANCDPNAACTNTGGSFTCACKTGFVGNGVLCEDNDECTLKTDNCDCNAACTNTIGSFTCACNSGFTGNGIACNDVDECTEGSANCGPNAACTNTPGSFICTCNTGYFGNGVLCKDLCGNKNFCNSVENSYCIKTETDQIRCRCFLGFRRVSPTKCQEINECDAIKPCDVNARCVNTPGSFTCTCMDGFTGDGFECEDINECQPNPCGPNADCDNQPGSFTCTCRDGFTGNGFACTDINECQPNPCDPNANCDNRPGSYTCKCNTGYTGNGFTCTDINECQQNLCHSNANCDNFPGSFKCKCKVGFTGNGFICTDINECQQNPCAPNANCKNFPPGSFTCTCRKGFTGNGLTCTDINECQPNPCALNADCKNFPGGFYCKCKVGFMGNPFELCITGIAPIPI